MDAPVTVEWLTPDPGAKQRSALEEWAMARGVRLVLPAVAHTTTLHVDARVGDSVEEELDRARDAMSAQEPEVATLALARAETALHEHPELPHAAWLMAEVQRAWAARWLRLEPRDEARAARAWQRAAGLDGGRVPGVGEQNAPVAPAVTATLAIESSGAFEARLDGAEIRPGPITRTEGEHALVVLQGGAPRFAAWVSITSGATIRITLGGPPACSTEDLRRAHLDGDTVVANGVSCSQWVAAFALEDTAANGPPRDAGGIRLATCRGELCGPLTLWRVAPSYVGLSPAPLIESPKKALPTWATLAIFGAGIVATSTIAILVSDAAKKPDPETRFVNGGIKVTRFGF